MQALIFDFDGTIVNSEPLHEEAIRDVLRPLGVTFTSEDFERRCLGFGAYRALTNLLDDGGCDWNDDLVSTLFDRKSEVLRVEIEAGRMPVFDGAVDLIREIAGTMPMGLCTGSHRSEVESILASIGVLDLFDAIVCVDDVSEPKPDPEGYLKVARALGMAPGDCVAIEDTPTGVQAALNAGMRVVAVCQTVDATRLAHAHATMPGLQGATVGALRALIDRAG